MFEVFSTVFISLIFLFIGLGCILGSLIFIVLIYTGIKELAIPWRDNNAEQD